MKFLLILLFISFLCSKIESKKLNSTSSGLKITVCMTKGKCNYFGTQGIQQAVADAITGMTIEIYAGAYAGAVIDKSLHIIGVNRQSPTDSEDIDETTYLNKRDVRKKKKHTKGKNASGTKTNTFPIDLCPSYAAVTINSGIILSGTGPSDGFVAGFIVLRSGSGSTFRNIEILGQNIWATGNMLVGIFGQTCEGISCSLYGTTQDFGSVTNVGIQCVQFQQIFQGIHFMSAESIYIYENLFNIIAPTVPAAQSIFGIRIGNYETGLNMAISNGSPKTWIMNSNNEIDHNIIILQSVPAVCASGIILPIFGSNFEITHNVLDCVNCLGGNPSYGIGFEQLSFLSYLSFTYVRDNKISAFTYGVVVTGAGDMIHGNKIQQSGLYGVFFFLYNSTLSRSKNRLQHNSIQCKRWNFSST